MFRTPPQSATRRVSSISSPNTADADDPRILVRPTSHIPWSVEVVSGVPSDLKGKFGQVVAGATCPGWACVAMRDGNVWVWPHQPISLSDKLKPPEHVVKLVYMNLVPGPRDGGDQGEPKPLMAFSRSGDGGEQQTVHLYVYKKPDLMMKKISLKDVIASSKSNIQHTVVSTKARVDLEDPDDEVVSLTTADDSGLVVLGTAKGELYWVQCTTVPVGLHLQKVRQADSGWLNRLGLTSSSFPPAPALQHVLPITGTQFLSLCSVSGTITKWDVTMQIASGHHASFESSTEDVSIAKVSGLDYPVILKAVLSPDHEAVYCIVRGQVQGETRLHWIHMSLDGTARSTHWLSRFPLPDQVEVLGCSASENGNVYAAFMASRVVVAMVLLREENMIQELDLPATHVPSLLPNLFARDTVTHGCSMLATSGIGIRARYLPSDSDSVPPSAKRSRSSASPSNPATVHNLTSHLRSHFWRHYEDGGTVQHPMPPSLKEATPSDLEDAILSFAIQLQQMGDTSSAQNPMEWHNAFIKLLMTGGLYRSISQLGRWNLFSIGQELAVFNPLTQMANSDWDAELRSYDIANWLLRVQSQQRDVGWPESNKRQWNALLSAALGAAMSYRDDKAHKFYDVVSDTPPEHLWLSHKSLQKVMRRQLEEWRNTNAEGVEPNELETIVRATLCSFSASYESKEDYQGAKSLAIRLLRSKQNDELAFELSIQYLYFEGLCQMSVDHEKLRDASIYSLDPLFETITGLDLMNEFSFAQYVLQWHTDKGLFGHTINYGRHSPGDLTHIMNQDERLRRYRWIPAIRQNFFDQATNSCLEICNEDNALGPNHWALSMAKLCDMVATGGGVSVGGPSASQRSNAIEKRLELVDAQRILMQGDENSLNSRLQTPEELVNLALKKLQEALSTDDKVIYGTVGLAVCTALVRKTAGDDSRTDSAANIWAACLRLDSHQFKRWLQQETDLTNATLRDTVLKDTVFGVLLEECRKDSALAEVTYGRHIEKAVMDRISTGEAPSLVRLLRSVTAPTDSIQGESLVVASF